MVHRGRAASGHDNPRRIVAVLVTTVATVTVLGWGEDDSEPWSPAACGS